MSSDEERQSILRYGVILIGAAQLVAVVVFLVYEYRNMQAASRSWSHLLRNRIIRLWVIMSLFNALNCACSIDHYMFVTEISDLAKCILNLGYFGGFAVSGVLYLIGVSYRCDPILTSHPWKNKFYAMTVFTNVMMVVSSSLMIVVVFAYGAPERRPFIWNVFPCVAGVGLCILCLSYGYIFTDYFRKTSKMGTSKPANYDRCRRIAYWGNISAACLLTAGSIYTVRFAMESSSIPDRVMSLLYHFFVTLGMTSQLMMRKKSVTGQTAAKHDSNTNSESVSQKTNQVGPTTMQEGDLDLESS